MTERTWQLVMTGSGLEHVTVQTRDDMARLLDLDPTISHLTIEIGDDSIHVTRDWPSDRTAEIDHLVERIVGSGVSALVIHDRTGKPPQRVASRG